MVLVIVHKHVKFIENILDKLLLLWVVAKHERMPETLLDLLLLNDYLSVLVFMVVTAIHMLST